MPESGDIALLKQYAGNGSEAAFSALVGRHVNLVYSAALRSAGNAHAAEEIAQVVFIILARKAKTLGDTTVLSGWLYQTARLTAANWLRGEIRRRRREQEAYMESALNQPGAEAWPQIAPLLDYAMGRLGEKDRNAIVLRFFENKNLAEVGAALGASEDAAKMRVNRALEKLRKLFARRGVKSTTAAIAENISANSVQIAPAALAKTISAVAVAKGAAASVSTLTLVKGALKIMAWTKMKTAIVAGTAAVLAIGTTTVAVKMAEQLNSQHLETYFTKMDSAYLETAPPMVLLRPSKYAGQGNYIIVADEPGLDERVMRRGCSFVNVLETAYSFGSERMSLPGILPRGEFDLLLTLPDNSRQALQAEIKKRFGIVAHPETRDTSVLLLKLVQTNALGLKISAGGGPNIWTGDGSLKLQGYKMSDAAHVIGSFFDSPVIDETGLTDAYDVDVHWNPNLQGNALRREMEGIMRDQFGLELVPTNMPLEMLVVEKAK